MISEHRRIFISVLVVMAMIFMAFSPLSSSGEHEMPRKQEKNDYNIYDRMTGTVNQMDSYRDNPQILNSSKGVLDSIPMENTGYATYTNLTAMKVDYVAGPDYSDMSNLFDEISQGSPVYNESSIVNFLVDWSDTLLPRPNLLNYWIYVNYSGHETWTKGFMRSQIQLKIVDGRLTVIQDPWREIDIDNDTTTGVNGKDIRVRLTPGLSLDHIPDITEVLQNLLKSGNNTLKFKGGLELDVENMGSEPLDGNITVAIIKSFSYEGKNNLISLSFQFPKPPQAFTASLKAGNIRISNVLTSTIENIINGGLGEIGNVSFLDALGGPYTLEYMDTDYMNDFRIDLGIARLILENGSYMGMKLNELLNLELKKSNKEDTVPRAGQLWLNSEGNELVNPIDQIKWTAGYGMVDENRYSNIFLRYLERKDNLMTYAKASVQNLPWAFNVSMDYTKVEYGKNVTTLSMEASDKLEYLDYYEYEMPNINGKFNDRYFKCNHVTARDVPPNIIIEVTSDLNRNITIPGPSPDTNSIIGKIIDSSLVKLISRFKRVGSNLRYLPENMMTIPGKRGWFTVEPLGREIGEVRFVRTSGPMLTYLMNGSYLASMNLTDYLDSTQMAQPDNKIPRLAMSGNFFGVGRVEMNFRDHSHLDLNLAPGRSLRVELQDPGASAMVNIDSMPEHMIIDAYPDRMSFESSNNIPSVTLYSEVENTHIAMFAEDIEKDFTIEKSNITTEIQSSGIGLVDVFITDNTSQFLRCSDADINSFILDLEKKYATAYLRMHGLKRFYYIPGKNGIFQVETDVTLPMYMYLYNTRSPTDILSRVYMDPLPNNISINLPGLVDTSAIKFPNMANMTGLVDMTSIVFTMGELGTNMLNIMSNTTQTLASAIGSMGSDMNLSYSLKGKELDIIMEVQRNLSHLPKEPSWVHGISIAKVQTDNESTDPEWAKIYISGLPPVGSISSKISNETIVWNIALDNFNPKYNYLIISTSGLRGRTISTYINGINPHSNLHVRINMDTYLGEDKGEMKGYVDIESSDGLGEVYVKIVRKEPIHSIREMFMPKVPRKFYVNFNITQSINLHYKADSHIEYMYVKISKFLDRQWHPMFLVVHDIPLEINLSIRPNTHFDFDGPIPLQGLPYIDLVTSEPATDAHIVFDGRSAGQKGKMEIFIRNAPTEMHTWLDGDHYKMECSGRLAYLSIEVLSLPMAEQYSVDYLHLSASNVGKLDLGMNMVFGVYPIIYVTNSQFSQLSLDINIRIKEKGHEMMVNTALLNLKTRKVIPTSISLERNKLDIEPTEKDESIYLVPMPVVSLVLSLL